MKFIFWNINGKDDTAIGQVIKDLNSSEQPDVLLLGETEVSDLFIKTNCGLDFISGIEKKSFGINKKLKLYSKNHIKILAVSEHGDGEILACGIEITKNNAKENYLVFGCHFVSKSTIKDEGKRLKRMALYKEFIESTERDYAKPPKGKVKNYKGALVFGDFNTNPFELSFTDTTGLFAIDIRNPAPRRLNKVKYFMNPSLSIMGNYCYGKTGNQSAPGTFFHVKKDLEISQEYFWNVLDGMFFRPELHDSYINGEPLEIITNVKDNANVIVHHLFDFTTHQINYSDHLPIKFKFNF